MMIFYPGWYLKEGPQKVFLESRIYLFWRCRWCEIREWKCERDASGLQVEGKFGLMGLTNPLAKPKSRHLMGKNFHSTDLHCMEKSKKGSPHRCVFTLFMMPPLNSIIWFCSLQTNAGKCAYPCYHLHTMVDVVITALSPKEAMNYFARPSFLKNTSLGREPHG